MIAPTRKGAHPEHWLRPPSLDLVDGWSREAGVVMATIAPELPGALEVIERLVAAGVVVSVGHTDADRGRGARRGRGRRPLRHPSRQRDAADADPRARPGRRRARPGRPGRRRDRRRPPPAPATSCRTVWRALGPERFLVGLRHDRRARAARRRRPGSATRTSSSPTARSGSRTAPWPDRRRRCSDCLRGAGRARPDARAEDGRDATATRLVGDDPRLADPAPRRPRRRDAGFEASHRHGGEPCGGRPDGGRPARDRRRGRPRSLPTRSRRWSASDPTAVLGLATGSSPLPTVPRADPPAPRGTGPSYDAVTVLHCSTSTSACRPVTRESYRATIRRELTDDLDIDRDPRARPGSRSGPAAGCGSSLRGGDRWPPEASTSRCSASAPTVTSRSTSPARRSPRRPGSRR